MSRLEQKPTAVPRKIKSWMASTFLHDKKKLYLTAYWVYRLTQADVFPQNSMALCCASHNPQSSKLYPALTSATRPPGSVWNWLGQKTSCDGDGASVLEGIKATCWQSENSLPTLTCAQQHITHHNIISPISKILRFEHGDFHFSFHRNTKKKPLRACVSA